MEELESSIASGFCKNKAIFYLSLVLSINALWSVAYALYWFHGGRFSIQNIAWSMKINPETVLGKQLVHLLTTWWHHTVVWKLNFFASRAVFLVRLAWENFLFLFQTIKDWGELLICCHELNESHNSSVENCFPSLWYMIYHFGIVHLHKCEQKSALDCSCLTLQGWLLVSW